MGVSVMRSDHTNRASRVSRRGGLASAPVEAVLSAASAASEALVWTARSRRAATSGPALSTSRLLAGRTFGRASPKTLRRSSLVPPWAPTPGDEQRSVDRREVELELLDGRAHGRPDDQADAPQLSPGPGRGVLGGGGRDHALSDAGVAQPGVLHAATLRVGGEREDEDPAAGRRGEVERRAQRLEAQVGAHRQGVARGDGVLAEVGLGVGRHGRPDVAALGVEDDQRARLAQGDDGALEDRHPARAEHLEEGGLRLHHTDVPRERLDAGVGEPASPSRS